MILDEGWIPLFRKLLNSQVFQSEGLLKVWIWCLLKVSHKGQWISVKTGKGTTEVHIHPGQFIFGRKSAAQELRMKESTVRKRLLKLESMQNLTIQSNTHYSIATLVNWAFYRNLMKKGNKQRNGQGPTKEHIQEGKEERVYTLDSHEFRLSELLLNLILERRNGFKRPDLQLWAHHIGLMFRVDKRDYEEVERVIRWCQADRFWQNNILSTAKLRKQYDQLALKMEKEVNENCKSKRFDEEDF